jgi:hypothetical protein
LKQRSFVRSLKWGHNGKGNEGNHLAGHL